jgi:hypothetical protein
MIRTLHVARRSAVKAAAPTGSLDATGRINREAEDPTRRGAKAADPRALRARDPWQDGRRHLVHVRPTALGEPLQLLVDVLPVNAVNEVAHPRPPSRQVCMRPVS